MSNTFLIIDDDINIRKMLKHLILKNNLGKVSEELGSGEHAPEEIVFYNPDIVLIDFLLPVKDGIEIIDSAISLGYKGKFIMVSQVEDENMITKAYENGIVFFIHKPINMIEALNVIRGVCHNIELEKSVILIKNAVFNIEKSQNVVSTPNIHDQMVNIFTDIGIIGESGSKDLMNVVEKIISFKRKNFSSTYQLQEIYQQIANEENATKDTHINARTIEQRIRRTILKALENIAELGNDDYYNIKFTEYSTRLFDLKQVKQEIKHLHAAKEDRGKINIKKFIEGMLSRLNF
ncbi:response regulator [Marinisporobacter balticus]|uniref:Stage 0 sporulation protein A homolog n=1 Tax=Marinisporobacter balticus TaxID=2018667 RepID=A0A4R2L7G6_9FIRM|nr:response regulator [Marinisporobacter balticus]TCO80079.1 two-component system response regulator YcbB [Marinisporobacter balticus]